MPSSISNSEFENQYQTLDSGSELKVRGKTFLAGLLMFVVVTGLYSYLTRFAPINDRALALIQQLPNVASAYPEHKKVMVFGTSMVQAGFEPYQFDTYFEQRDMDVVSYNYGVGNLNPEFQQYLTAHIRREMQAADASLDLVLLEFNPFQTTKAREVIGAYTRDQNEAELRTVRELWETTLEDPDRGIRLFNIRYLRNGLSAELLTSALFLLNAGLPEVNDAYREASLNRSEMASAFFESAPMARNFFGAVWHEDLRGGRIDKRVLPDEALDALQLWADSFRNETLMEFDLQRRVVQGDILELDFADHLVKAFINMVRDLDAVSDNMEVILLPRNTDWVDYTPEVQARLDALMQRITDETGVAVRNFQTHPEIGPEMFVDTTHLSFANGIDTFTRVLAESYEPVLR
ncbi:MAG: hypothetical protein RL839_11880 [Gammaproteobacteria bacterium]